MVTHGRSRRISQLPAVREAKARLYVCVCWVRIDRSKLNLTVSDLLIGYFLIFFGIWEQCNKSRMLSLLLFQFFFWPALKKAKLFAMLFTAWIFAMFFFVLVN